MSQWVLFVMDVMEKLAGVKHGNQPPNYIKY